MKYALIFALSIFFFTDASAQFRMVGTGSWTTVNDSTYSATLTFSADLTGNGYLATQILQDSFRVFTGLQKIYRIDTVYAQTFSSATMVVVEYGGTQGAPSGQVMVYNPNGLLTVPQCPIGSTGSTAQLQAAVVTHNAKQVFGIPNAAQIPLADPIDFGGVVTDTVQEALEAIDARLDSAGIDTSYVRNDSVFVVSGGVEYFSGSFVDNPVQEFLSSPEFQDTILLGGAIRANFIVQGNYLYVHPETTNKLQIWDISRPDAKKVSETTTGLTGIVSTTVRGDYCVVSRLGASRIYNISNPSSPTLIASPTVGLNVIYQQYLFGSDGVTYLYKYNISTGATTTIDLVSTGINLQFPDPIIANQDQLYISSSDGSSGSNKLVSVNWINETIDTTLNVGTTATSAAKGMAMWENYLYIAGASSLTRDTLWIFSLDNPSKPRFIKQYCTGSDITSITPLNMVATAGYLYYPVDSLLLTKVVVFDLKYPTTPQKILEFSSQIGGSSGRVVKISGESLYIGCRFSNWIEKYKIVAARFPTVTIGNGTFSNIYGNTIRGKTGEFSGSSYFAKAITDYVAFASTWATRNDVPTMRAVYEMNAAKIDGIYLPTATKSLSTDTIITVYTHLYSRNDTVMNVSGRLLVNNASGTASSSLQLTLPPGFTSDFTDAMNDVTGSVTCMTSTFPATLYAARVKCDTSTDKIVIEWTCDPTDSRQEIDYIINIRKK